MPIHGLSKIPPHSVPVPVHDTEIVRCREVPFLRRRSVIIKSLSIVARYTFAVFVEIAHNRFSFRQTLSSGLMQVLCSFLVVCPNACAGHVRSPKSIFSNYISAISLDAKLCKIRSDILRVSCPFFTLIGCGLRGRKEEP